MTKPLCLAACTENIVSTGAYIMDNGDYIVLYIGS